MNFIAKFFHELRNPHCSHCLAEKEDSKICQSCESLKMEIGFLRQQNSELLNKLIEKPIPAEEPERNTKIPVPMRPTTWQVRRQMLEAEDRQRAKILADRAREEKINQIENEIGLNGIEDDKLQTNSTAINE